MTNADYERQTEPAYRTVLVYRQYAGIEDLPLDAAIQQLVSDLRGLADEYGCDLGEVARNNSSEER
jgi:hypothetical protein